MSSMRPPDQIVAIQSSLKFGSHAAFSSIGAISALAGACTHEVVPFEGWHRSVTQEWQPSVLSWYAMPSMGILRRPAHDFWNRHDLNPSYSEGAVDVKTETPASTMHSPAHH